MKQKYTNSETLFFVILQVYEKGGPNSDTTSEPVVSCFVLL